jgi:hypothetical protein
MKAHHRVSAFPPAFNLKHPIDRAVVYVGHEYLPYTFFFTARKHVIPVSIEFFRVYVRMCISPVLHESNELNANIEYEPQFQKCPGVSRTMTHGAKVFDIKGYIYPLNLWKA